MKFFLSVVIAIIFGTNVFAQIYITKIGELRFFFTTPVEDISAVNSSLSGVLNTSTSEVQMRAAITGFVFKKPLMQEHFNENYMESDKFPTAIFKGKINEEVDYSKDGVYNVTVTGKLTIHGVEKERTLDGTITVKERAIMIASQFKVKFADHDIEIPTLQTAIIPKETDVKITGTFEPYKKK